MKVCYAVCRDYGVAIVLFTFISKIVMLPISVWLQYNSIKMVRMQPEINLLKARYYGDRERIDEGQALIFKREKYNPFASIIPVVVQLVLLMGLIAVIRQGMEEGSVSLISFGVDLSAVPSERGGAFILSPVTAALAAWILCLAQNASNVLQSEQSGYNKHGMTVFSVALSLYLGWFVPVGVAVYWTASNLMAVAQLYIMNTVIPPSKYVDYEKLEASKAALEAMVAAGKSKAKLGREDKKRERADYKRFFSVLNRHLVFYSESSGFYKYYRGIIEWLLANSNLTIHYVTSDPADAVFEFAEKEPRIRPYFIAEKKLITLMMKLETDVMVMTMPDLENYHIKRSYIKKDIEYVYIPHGMDSHNLCMRTGSTDHYDTIFCTGAHQKEEAQRTEEVYGLPKRKLVEWGYTLLDDMLASYEEAQQDNPVPRILIAPSWQEDNIVDSCLEELLDSLKGRGYMVTVRPHPQHVRHESAYFDSLKSDYADSEDIEIQTDFSSNSTVFEADVLITDWSGIAFEYAYTTLKPVLFINTPMKVMNPEYEKIGVVPINIWAREAIGRSLELSEVKTKVGDAVAQLLGDKEAYRERILKVRTENHYNPGRSAEVGGSYILESIRQKIADKKTKQKT